MIRPLPAAVCLALALAAAASAMAAIPGGEAATLRRAIDRGRLIYAFDQAAWLSADAMARQIPDPAAAHVAGWVVDEVGGSQHVIYYRMDGAVPRAVYSADVRGGTVTATHLFSAAEDQTLTPLEVRMGAARSVAAAQHEVACADAPFNTVVLPPVTPDGPIAVYLLTPQTRRGAFPFGGHYEIDVAVGGRVVSTRAFTKSCLTMTLPAPGAGGATAAVYVSHLLDPTPTEIHVYLSLWMGLPIYVGTGKPRRVWEVTGDKISLVR